MDYWGPKARKEWQYERRITPHIEAILAWDEILLPEKEISFEHAPELMTLANVCFYEGRYSDAEHLYLRALAYREYNLGPDR